MPFVMQNLIQDLMKNWLFSALIFLPVLSLSQTPNFDTSIFRLYTNSDEGISFIYPKGWQLSNESPFIFRATEYLGDSTDKYRESIYFGKLSKFTDLKYFTNTSAQAIKSQNRRKISIIEKGVKKNENAIIYGMIINKAVQKNLTGIKTHIYFDTDYGRYFLVFENDISKSLKYEPLYSAIIQSIKTIK